MVKIIYSMLKEANLKHNIRAFTYYRLECNYKCIRVHHINKWEQ